jgi:hypothetical protein
MDLMKLIEALDQRYGNPHAKEQYHLIQEAVIMLQEQQNQIAVLEQQRDAYAESHAALLAHNLQKGKLES